MLNYHRIKWKRIIKNTFQQSPSCIVVLTHPNVFFALLEDIEHRRDTKDFCLFTKENKETEKKSLDLLLHERSFFLLCEVVLSYSLYLVPTSICVRKATFKRPENRETTWYNNKPVRERPKVSFSFVSFWHSKIQL